MKARESFLGSLLAVILVTGAAANMISSWQYTIWPRFTRAWNLRELEDWQRAAILAEGDEFGEFISFIRDHVPPESRVIIPPHNIRRPYAHMGLMQFYLFPRDIHNCGVGEVEACVSRIGAPTTYILAVPGFPPRDLAEIRLNFEEFHDDFGLYVPDPALQ